METKKLESLKKRIQKANRSLSVMGDMMLSFEVDAMTLEQKVELQTYLASKGVSYLYLNETIKKAS